MAEHVENHSIIKAFIIAVSVIATGAVLGHSFRQRNAAADAISVVGLGVTSFTSDEILFSGSYDTKAIDAKEAYAMINVDKEKVRSFFIAKGFKPEEFSLGGVNFEKAYRTITVESKSGEENTRTEQVFDGYIAKQSVTLASRQNPDLMRRIEKVAEQTSELINSGIQFQPNQVQYTYSDLPGLKHTLIERASQDAKERAQKIVKTANGNLGKLKTASMGVFQITGEGSVSEDTYGGNNDIYSKEKSARITVRLEYQLD